MILEKKRREEGRPLWNVKIAASRKVKKEQREKKRREKSGLSGEKWYGQVGGSWPGENFVPSSSVFIWRLYGKEGEKWEKVAWKTDSEEEKNRWWRCIAHMVALHYPYPYYRYVNISIWSLYYASESHISTYVHYKIVTPSISCLWLK